MSSRARCGLLLALALASCSQSGSEPTPGDTRGLRDLASQRDFRIGSYIEKEELDQDPAYAQLTAKHFNTLAVTVYWTKTRPSETEFDFSAADDVVEFAAAHDMLVRITPVVWWQSNPEWLEKYRGSDPDLRRILEAHVKGVVSHFQTKFPGRVLAYELVNEPLDYVLKRPKEHIWTGIQAGDPVEYIRLAFRWAREAAPDARLFINDIFLEADDCKFSAYMKLIRQLQADGVSLNGIGLQMHQYLPFPVSGERFRERLAEASQFGLEIHVTEADLGIPFYPSESMLAWQRELFRDYVAGCLASERCTTFAMWGASDKYSWISRYFSGFGWALPFDEEMAPKPAYYGIREALGGGSSP